MESIPWKDYSFVGYAIGIVILAMMVLILTVVYFLAKCSSCTKYSKNSRGCRCYAMIMLICGTALLGLGILLMKDNSTVDNITKLFQKQWKDRNEQQRFWNTIQGSFKCCGINSAFDWGANVPNSCCEGDTVSCTTNNAYKNGCLDVVTNYYQNVFVVILTAIAFVSVAVCIIGLIFACAVNISCQGRN